MSDGTIPCAVCKAPVPFDGPHIGTPTVYCDKPECIRAGLKILPDMLNLRQKETMKTKQVIPLSEWDSLVTNTYGRPYSLQQQDGCTGRGSRRFRVPDEPDDFATDSVPEQVNHEKKGVNFKAWLARDPKQKLSDPDAQEDYCLDLWWSRNFYPGFQMIANDMHAKGLLDSGEHTILIDW